MTDHDFETRAIRYETVRLAQSLIGSHYLKGTGGATPGNKDGVWYKTGEVNLHANETKRDRRQNRTQPILYAVTWRLNKNENYHVCAGRRLHEAVKCLPKGDPNNEAHTKLPWHYRWERPKFLMEANESVFGECCEGIRHFDCVYFVNYVMARVMHERLSISQWIGRTDEKDFSDVRAGDVLTRSGHIGIATDDHTVVHAEGENRGVVETSIYNDGWDRCGRIKAKKWRKLILHEPATSHPRGCSFPM